MKKILIFLPRLSGGGAERTIVNIIRNMDLTNIKITLVLACNTPGYDDYIHLIPKEVKIINFNLKKFRYSLLKLIKTIKKEKPDLVFSTLYAANLYLFIANLITRKPIVIRETNYRTESGEISKLNKILTYITYNNVDKVIALSYGVKDDLIQNFKINPDNIEVIYNPVDVDYINSQKNLNCNDWPFKKDDTVIISVGRLEEQKNFKFLIKSFDQIQKENKNAKLLILGKGSKENELLQQIKQLGHEENIKLIGFRKNPYKYLNKADLFILSSKWEGFGHVIVEALVCETPVVSTNCKAGPSEILKNGFNGFLCKVNDVEELTNKAGRLLVDEHLAEKFVERGYQRGLDFSAQKISLEYTKLFKKAIKRNVL